MRKIDMSRLPSGPPEDTYLLEERYKDFSIAVDPTWIPVIKEEKLHDFDSKKILEPGVVRRLDTLMLDSPFGPDNTVENWKDQYLFLREAM